MKLTKLTDIIPLLEEGKSLAEIGRSLRPRRAPSTMWRYAKQLRDAGYTVPTTKGRRKLKL